MNDDDRIRRLREAVEDILDIPSAEDIKAEMDRLREQASEN